MFEKHCLKIFRTFKDLPEKRWLFVTGHCHCIARSLTSLGSHWRPITLTYCCLKNQKQAPGCYYFFLRATLALSGKRNLTILTSAHKLPKSFFFCMSYFVTIHLLIPFGIGYWLRNMNETKQKS
jgi:hypothetical protein